MPRNPAPDCPECGHPTDSRVHLEGRGGVHVSTAASTAHPGGELTNRELIALLTEAGIEVPPRANKAQLVALVEGIPTA